MNSQIFKLILLLACLPICTADASQFEEVTTGSGIDYIGESKGASWADYNGDGWPDVWVTNRYDEFRLYVNNGNGTYTDSSSVITSSNYGAYGSAWGDFDNDGDPDILNAGPGGCGGECTNAHANIFLVNDNGFLVNDAASYGVDYPLGRGRTPLWFDWDIDGRLDLLVSNAARSDGAGPTAFLTQDEGRFIDDTAVAGISPLDSKFAQLARFAPGAPPRLIAAGSQYPLGIYDYSAFPFLDIQESIGLPMTYNVQDAIIADFNGDLLTDVFLARSNEYNSAAILIDTNVLGARLKAVGDQKAFRFKATGSVHFEIYGDGLTPLNEIHIGENATVQATRQFTLSDDDPAVIGIQPHEPGIDTGIYIGYQPADGFWEIQLSSPARKARDFRIEADSPISELNIIGFENFEDIEITDRLFMQFSNGFVDNTVVAGLDTPTPCGSAVAADFDNDMDLDIYMVCRGSITNRANILYENLGDGTFLAEPEAGGAEGSTLGRGDSVATADFDNDGFMDFIVTNGDNQYPFNKGPHQLFRNLGNMNHWLEIDLEGVSSNRDGIGAQIIATAGEISQVRDQNGGMHLWSQNHQRIHFGLGDHTVVDRITVYWPSGIVQELENIEADAIIRIVEPSGAPQPPVAVGDNVNTDMDTATTVDVLVNDYDPNRETLAITTVQSPTDQGGIATINDNSTPDDPGDDFIDYTPPGGFADTDTFTYTIDDGTGFADTATVIVTVKASSTCNLYGEPNYGLETEDGIFLWKEGAVWHLRAVAGSSGWQKYTGSIVSDMEFSNVTPVSLEASDTLDTSNAQEIIFDLRMSAPWIDGIDFEAPAGATIYFDVQASSGDAADLVFIGGDRCPIDQLPYQLSSESSNTLPVAIFTADPVLGEVPLYMSFDASMSYDPDAEGSIVSYEWNYGDGTDPESGLTTSNHTYNTPGIYIVTLTVTDNAGSSDTASQTITVGSSNTCNPYGEPNYGLETEDGIFLWKEGNVWHLRAVAGSSGWQKYIGSIVSDIPPISVTPVSLEASDTLDTSNAQEIIFDLRMSAPWLDGVDFEVEAGAAVYVDVQASSGDAADLVFIGENRCPIDQLPYQLP